MSTTTTSPKPTAAGLKYTYKDGDSYKDWYFANTGTEWDGTYLNAKPEGMSDADWSQGMLMQQFDSAKVAAGAQRDQAKQGLTDLYKSRRAAIIATVIVILTLVIVMPLIMFGGKLEIAATDTAIEIDADMWRDCTIAYEQIQAAEYREHTVDGQRINGVGSAKLLLGVFRNAEFGTYIRYTYTGDLPCIVLTVGGETYVIATDSAEQTEAIYKQIQAGMEK